MTTLDITAAEAALKQLYPSRKIKYLGYEGNPLLALMPKDESFLGESKKMPLWYGGNQGASRDFATAQNNKTPGKYKAFLLTRVKDYGLSSIATEAILASGSDEGAFLRLASAEIDNTVRTVSRNLAISMYRNHGGARGQIAASGISSLVFTLSNPADVVNFEVDQTLVNSTADGTSGSLGSGNTTITAVDRRNGKITVASATGFSAGDYLFRKGDFGVSISGLADWIPATNPAGAENFFGVDRSSDTRLYGQFHDGSTQTMQEALEAADVKVAREGGSMSHFFMNTTDFGSLRTSLGSSVVYDKVRSPDTATISFSTIKLMGVNGDIQIVPDRNCPVGVSYGLDLKTWEAGSLGGAPRVLEQLGNKFIWDANADSIEIRVGYFGNVGCYAPVYNCQVKFY